MGKQAEVIGAKNLLVNVVKAMKLEERSTGLEDQGIATEIADGYRLLWLTVDGDSPRGGNGNYCI